MSVEATLRSLLLEAQNRTPEPGWVRSFFTATPSDHIDFASMCAALSSVAEIAGEDLEMLAVDPNQKGLDGHLVFATVGDSWNIVGVAAEGSAEGRFESLLIEDKSDRLDDPRLLDAPVAASPDAPVELVDCAAEVVERYGLVGLSVATTRGAVAVGFRDLEANDPLGIDDALGCGSVTKMIVATAALRLVAEGKVDLDSPVAPVLGGLVSIPDDRVTVRHLLSHTSGMGSNIGDLYAEEHEPHDLSCLDELYQSDPPGERHSYNNAAFGVLGAVLRQTTNSSLQDLLEDLVLWPLGMTETRLEQSRPTAVGYEVRNRTATRLPPRMITNSAAGGIVTTARDLLILITRWHTLLTPELVADALTIRAPAESFGLGWQIGPTRFGHTGGAAGITAAVTANHDNTKPVAVLTNRGHAPISKIAAEFLPYSD